MSRNLEMHHFDFCAFLAGPLGVSQQGGVPGEKEQDEPVGRGNHHGSQPLPPQGRAQQADRWVWKGAGGEGR